jgi:hypothetical protein
MVEQIKDNVEKIKNNKQLPYLVGNVVEVRRISMPLEACAHSEQGRYTNEHDENDRFSTSIQMKRNLSKEATSTLTPNVRANVPSSKLQHDKRSSFP